MVNYAGIVIIIDEVEFHLLSAKDSPSPPPEWDTGAGTWNNEVPEFNVKFTNLNTDAWAMVVTTSHKEFCIKGGNCIGWAKGTFGREDMVTSMGHILPKMMKVEGKDAAKAAYLEKLKSEEMELYDLLDFYMLETYNAKRVATEEEAQYALYGFEWTREGNYNATHIAIKLEGEFNFWFTKTGAMLPFVHISAAQLEGHTMGKIIGYFKSDKKITHIRVKE